MKKSKLLIFILAGLIVAAGIIWAVISTSNQQAGMSSAAVTATITPEQIPESGASNSPGETTPDVSVSPKASSSVTSSPSATPYKSPTKTKAPTTTKQTAKPASTPTATTVPTKTAAPTPTATAAPTKTTAPTATAAPTKTTSPTATATPTPTATATPEPTPAFSYSVYNKDGVAPAGYTIVYIKITPHGSYHVTYNGKTITKSKSGSGYITYYTTVEKLEGGNYRSKVSVSS